MREEGDEQWSWYCVGQRGSTKGWEVWAGLVWALGFGFGVYNIYWVWIGFIFITQGPNMYFLKLEGLNL